MMNKQFFLTLWRYFTEAQYWKLIQLTNIIESGMVMECLYKQACPLGLCLWSGCWKHLCPALQLRVMVPFISKCCWDTELAGAVYFGGSASSTLGSVCSDQIQVLLFNSVLSFVLKRSGIFLIQSFEHSWNLFKSRKYCIREPNSLNDERL